MLLSVRRRPRRLLLQTMELVVHIHLATERARPPTKTSRVTAASSLVLRSSFRKRNSQLPGRRICNRRSCFKSHEDSAGGPHRAKQSKQNRSTPRLPRDGSDRTRTRAHARTTPRAKHLPDTAQTHTHTSLFHTIRHTIRSNLSYPRNKFRRSPHPRAYRQNRTPAISGTPRKAGSCYARRER